MKYILIIFFLAFISSNHSQNANSSFSIYKVLSNTHPNFGMEVQKYYWRPPLSGVISSLQIDSIYQDTILIEYNLNGNEIMHRSSGKWNRCHLITYEYDNYGRQIKEISSSCNRKNNNVVRTEFSDTLIKIISSDFGKNIIVYSLDSNNNTVKRSDYHNDQLSSFYTKEYDSNNNVIDFKYFSQDTLVFHEVYSYGDSSELLSSEVKKHPYILPNVYDFLGNEMVSFSNLYRTIYKYDIPNLKISEYSINLDNDTLIKNYLFDQYGNIAEINSSIDSNNVIESQYKYEYDDLGNVIRRETIKNGKIIDVRVTKYDYKSN